jgi:hypothetical protein
VKPAQLDLAVESCRAHLASSSAKGTDIEKYLTAHLVVMACATFEEILEDSIKKRAERSGDAVLASLVESAIGIVLRSIRTSELAGVLNRFSEDHKRDFQTKMADNPRAETSYNSIIGQRQASPTRQASLLPSTNSWPTSSQGMSCWTRL